MGHRRIAVIAPHADDAELGVGGYLHRELSAGNVAVDVFVLAAHPPEREAEGKHAAFCLGPLSYHFLKAVPDSGFNSVPAGRLVQVLEDALFSVPLDEVFIPLPSFHEDHQIAYRAAVAALRPHRARQQPDKVFCYEYPIQFWGPEPPAWGKTYARLEKVNVDAKIASLACHHSQAVSDPSSLLGERGVNVLARQRGLECGTLYAELFYAMKGTL